MVKKDVYNAKIKDIEDKIPDITNLATNTTLNTKLNEVENKITSITNLATTAAIIAVENKIPDHSKYLTNPEFNKLTADTFTARLKQATLATKGDIAVFVKKTNFDDKLKKLYKEFTSNKPKHLLVENELKKLQDKIQELQAYD